MESPRMAWKIATIIVVKASRGCHLKGITEMPLKFNAPMVAVNSKSKKVKMPPYITSGWLRINV